MSVRLLGDRMKLIMFGGTPGSGKTSVIKNIIERLESPNIHYVKFDVLRTEDDSIIEEKFGISVEKKIAGDVCPDHYTALTLPKIVQEHKDKDYIFAETAGLCLRCSPYVDQGLGVNVLNITAGKPYSYGPLLTQADVVAITKSDLVSQAEGEIFRSDALEMNSTADVLEVNGLTGEGSMDLAEFVKDAPRVEGKLNLRHSMPTAVCGYCYGNQVVDSEETLKRYNRGKELKARVPNKNCGKCGFKTCNEFIRAVLDGRANEDQCPFLSSAEEER